MLASSLGMVILFKLTVQLPAERAAAEPPWEMILTNIITWGAQQTSGQGPTALVEWFRSDPMLTRAMHIVLVDQHGRVLLQPDTEPPEGAKAPLEIAFAHDDLEYTAVVTPRRPPMSDRPSPNRFMRMLAILAVGPVSPWAILAIAIPLSVGLSFLIARYLVKPLRSFEAAGRRLSEGDFSARIAPALGNRSDEIADFAATFDQMAVRIEALVSSHKVLLRDVSHELRSPLARVQAAVSLARQRTGGAVDPELERIERELERLNTMIGKLLTFSRLDAREVDFAAEEIDLDWLLADVVRETSIEAKASGKRIELHLHQGSSIDGDVELLTSLFENVIRNAVRHTPEGAEVSVSLHNVDDPAVARVIVRDHGDGVPEDQLERMFDPFYRTDEGRASHAGGAGIGLAIAKSAAALHGGTISAANTDDGGLAVTIDLPLPTPA